MSFIGFEAFAAPASDDRGTSCSPGTALSDGVEPVYTGGDGELAVLCRKLAKKDVTTKVKGLIELRATCATKPAPVLRKVVPHLIHVYGRLCYDRDRRVREQLNTALHALVKAAPRAVSNRIKHIIGPWWVLMSDTCPEVAVAANAAFDTLYDPKHRHDRPGGVLECSSLALSQHLQFVLGFNPAAMVASKLCSPEDVFEVYERLMGSVLSCLARLIMERQANGDNDLILRNILDAKVWHFLCLKRFPLIRREAYNLLNIACRHAPAYVQRPAALAELSHLALAMLDEAHAPNAVGMWECLLAFIRTCPSDCWGNVNCAKAVLPKFLQLLRRGGIPQQFILPVVSTLRVDDTRAFKAGSAKFYREWLEAMWQTTMSCRESPEEHSGAVVVLVECSLYVLLCQRDEKSGDATGVLNKTVASTVGKYFLRAFRCFLEWHVEVIDWQAGSLARWFRDIASALSSAMIKVTNARDGGQRRCVAQFCPEPLSSAVWDIIRQGVLPKPKADSAPLPGGSRQRRELQSTGRIVLLLSLVVESSESSQAVRQHVLNTFESVLAACRSLCNNPDYSENISLAIEFLVGISPVLKPWARRPLFADEYQAAPDQPSLMTCLGVILTRTCDNSSNGDAVRILQLVHEIVTDALETSAKRGLAYWQETLRVCVASPGERIALIQLALEHATPDPRDIYARYEITLSDDIIDHAVLDVWTQDNRDSATTAAESFLVSCFGGHKDRMTNGRPAWPLLSGKALARCIDRCVERGPCVWCLSRLRFLFDCVSPTSSDVAPHLEAVLHPYKVALAQLMFQCRLIPSGPAFCDKHLHFVLSLDTKTFVADLALQLRALLEGGGQEFDWSSCRVELQWAEQVSALLNIMQRCGFRQDDSRAEVFRTIGLLDTSLWSTIVMSVDSGQGNIDDRAAARLWKCSRELLEVAGIPTMLGQLHCSGMEARLPSVMWNIFVVGSTTESRALHPSLRERTRLARFFAFTGAPMLTGILDSHPANSEVVDFIAKRMRGSSNDELLHDVLRDALDDVSSICDDRPHSNGTLRRLEILLYITCFLGDDLHAAKRVQVGPTATKDAFIGAEMWYEMRPPSGPPKYEPVRVISVDTDDTRQYYTVVSKEGQERQTIAERLHSETPKVTSNEQDVYTASIDDHLGALVASAISIEKQIRERVGIDAPNTVHSLAMGLDAVVSYLCLRLLDTTDETVLASFLSESCSYWTALLSDSLGAADVTGQSRSMTSSYLAMSGIFLTSYGGEGHQRLKAQRTHLTAKVLAASLETPTSNLWYHSTALHWLTRLISTRVFTPLESLNLWRGVSDWFDLLIQNHDGTSKLICVLDVISCVEALLNCTQEVATIEAANFAMKLLVLIFIEVLKSSEGAQRGTFRANMREQILRKCVASLTLVTSSPTFDAADFKINSHEVAYLCDCLKSGPASLPIQLAAFNILSGCMSCTIAEPFNGGGASASGAFDKNYHDTSEAENEELTHVAQRHISKGVWSLLHGTASLTPKQFEGEGTVGGVSESIFLETTLSWLLLLGCLDNIVESKKAIIQKLAPWIKSLPIFPSVLEICTTAYCEHTEQLGRSHSSRALYGRGIEVLPRFLEDEQKKSRFHFLAGHVMFRTICALPAMVRQWWSSSCPRPLSTVVQRFVEMEVSESLARREVSYVQSTGSLDASFTINGSSVSREITAIYIKDECSLEVVIRLPPAYPLRNVEVECRRRLGISEACWRRWVLQIITLLSTQDGSVLDAILLWKHNVDNEFEGLEPCPICYSIAHPRNVSLPSIVCHTCSSKFHPDCLYKWFNTSHKNKCPLCQQTMNL